MVDLDKMVFLSCPAECGQNAVQCSVRMLLQQEVFFCGACGYEYCGKDHPDWINQASHGVSAGDLSTEYDLIKALYNYFYGSGKCPEKKLLTQLLQAEPEAWRLFPKDKIPAAALIDKFNDPAFAAEFDFAALGSAVTAELLALRPDFASRCDLQCLTGEDWAYLITRQTALAKNCAWAKVIEYAAKQTVSSGISSRSAAELFALFPGCCDMRFKTAAAGAQNDKTLGNTDNFFAVVNYFNFWKNVDWSKFSSAEMVVYFKKYPKILTVYPFTRSNQTGFDWKSFSSADWQRIKPFKDEFPADFLAVYNVCNKINLVAELKKNQQLEKITPWKRLTVAEWVEFLIALPEKKAFWAYCPWDKFKSANWQKILESGKCDYAQAVYYLRNGQRVAGFLKKYPESIKFVEWSQVSGVEWLELLAVYPQFALKCPWAKVYDCIAELSPEQQQSVKAAYPKLWERRAEILDHASAAKLQRLSPEKFFAVLDFFDWENAFNYDSLSPEERMDLFSKHPQFLIAYGEDKLTSDEKVQLALRSAEFAASYGWNKFTEEEALAILKRNPDYYPYFKGSKYSQKFWSELAEYDERFTDRCRLRWSDYLLFRRFKSKKLCSRVNFFWHFIICLATFAACAYNMFDGPCGFAVLWHEAKLHAFLAGVIYVLLAFLWSLYHSWLFSGRTPRVLTLCFAIFGGWSVALQYSYTFFLAKISLSNYISSGLFLFLSFCLLCVKLVNKEIVSKKAEGFVMLGIYYLLPMLTTLLLCQPLFHWQYLRISSQLSRQPRAFVAAGNYYALKAFESDDKSRKLIEKLEEALKKSDCRTAGMIYEKIAAKYPSLPIVKELQKRIEDCRKKLEQKSRHCIELFNKKEYDKLIDLLKSADSENPEIQYIYGWCYSHGLGKFKIDYTQAANWYKKAASRNNTKAMNELGNFYAEGKGVEKSAEKAYKLYSMAANDGFVPALNNAAMALVQGNGVKKNLAEAYKLFLKAAQKDNAFAQRQVALMSYCAMGTKRNDALIANYLTKAAAQGETIAQQMLGSFYLAGVAVKRDYDKAVMFLRKAAQKNNATAQTLLGMCYIEGAGVEADAQTAIKWLTEAAKQEEVNAQITLFKIYSAGKLVPENKQLALKWLQEAAAESPEAQCELGICYLNGYGVRANKSMGKYFLKKSQAGGYARAGEILKKLR